MKRKRLEDDEFTGKAVSLESLLTRETEKVKEKRKTRSRNRWSYKSEAELNMAHERLASILDRDEYIEWFIRPSSLMLPQFYLSNKRFIQPNFRLSLKQTLRLEASIPYSQIVSVKVSGIIFIYADINIVCRGQENFNRGNLFWGAARKTKKKLMEKVLETKK